MAQCIAEAFFSMVSSYVVQAGLELYKVISTAQLLDYRGVSAQLALIGTVADVAALGFFGKSVGWWFPRAARERTV